MRTLKIDNYIITIPLLDVLYELKRTLTNGKLKDIKPSGDDIVVTCPHHADGRESNPDCNIYIGDPKPGVPYGYARCFACDFKGNFVKLVAECFERSELFAKQWLIENFGEKAEDVIIIDEPIILNNVKKEKVLDESILEQYQHWCPYLAKRKLTREMCENFKVRYDSYHRQVIFPVYDIHNKLKMLARRSIDTKFFHMDSDVEKEVYGLNIIQKNNIKSCIITEGPFDMLRGWSLGVPTIATLGTISDYQIEQINKSCLNVIYTMFDNDEAGRKFTDVIKSKVSKRILVIQLTIPNGFKDLNDLDDATFYKVYNEGIK